MELLTIKKFNHSVKEKLFSGVSSAQRKLMNVTMKMILKNTQE